MLGDRLARTSSQAYKRAMCSPFFKETIHPKVQLIWAMFPLDCCFGFSPLTMLINGCLLPCLWPIIVPVYQWIVIPWNVFWFVGVGPLLIFCCCPFIACTGLL